MPQPDQKHQFVQNRVGTQCTTCSLIASSFKFAIIINVCLTFFFFLKMLTNPAYERAVRMKKRRTELAQVKRENNEYLLKVERAKVQRIMKERKVHHHHYCYYYIGSPHLTATTIAYMLRHARITEHTRFF